MLAGSYYLTKEGFEELFLFRKYDGVPTSKVDGIWTLNCIF